MSNRFNHCTCILGLLVLFTLLLLSTHVFGQVDQELLGILQQHVPQKEKVLANIKIESEYKTEVWNSEKKLWEKSEESEIMAWYIGIPNSLARVDYIKQKLPWRDGPAPFGVSRLSASFNGKAGQIRYYSVGTEKDQIETKRGEITPNRPEIIARNGSCGSGWRFSLWGYGESTGHNVSYYLNIKKSDVSDLIIERTTFETYPCIVATAKIGKSTYKWYFDQSLDYSLRGYERFQIGVKPFERVVVQEFFEAAPGLYYPKRAMREVNEPASGAPRARGFFEAKNVIVNDPKFSNKIFDLTWPAGGAVYDKTTETVYHTAGTPMENDDLIETQTERVKRFAATATAPASQKSSESSLQASTSGPLVPSLKNAPSDKDPDLRPLSNQPENRLWLWYIVAGMAIAGGVGYFIWKKGPNKPSNGNGMLLLLVATAMVVYPHQAWCYDTTLAQQQFQQQKLQNCGVNCALLTLRYFGKSATSQEVGEKIGLDQNWLQPVSLLQIQKVLQAYDLRVEAYKSVTIDDIKSHINSSTLGIVHTTVEDDPSGHYYVIAATTDTHLLLVNAGMNEMWVTLADFRDRYAPGFSGYVLFISEKAAMVLPQMQPTKILDFRESAFEYNLGDVSAGQGELHIPINATNQFDRPVIIEEVKASCGCLKHAKFSGKTPLQIAPMVSNTLDVVFNKAAIGSGRVERLIMLKLKNASVPNVVIKLKMNVIRTKDAAQLAWFPERLDLGIINKEQAVKEKLIITLFVPRNNSIIAERSELIDGAVIESDQNGGGEDNSRTTFRYVGSLKTADDGNISTSVKLQVRGKLEQEIVIPVTGRIR